MDLWWSYGGYVFPDVVNQTIWHFKGNLTFKVKVNRQSYTPVILPKVVCTCGPNLVILAWMGDELWCGQAQDEVNVDFWGEFEFEVQGRLPLNVFCIFGQNVVILGWTGLELLDRHVSDWYTHTDTQTDAGNDNTRRLKLALGKKSLQYQIYHLLAPNRRMSSDYKNVITGCQYNCPRMQAKVSCTIFLMTSWHGHTFHITGFCMGIHWLLVDFPRKGWLKKSLSDFCVVNLDSACLT